MDAPSAIQLFVSNRYERLYQHLHAHLFGAHPSSLPCESAFAPRLIVTPNPTLYQIVTTQLAVSSTCKIAMGVTHLPKESLCTRFSQWFAPLDREIAVRPFPHYLELVFSIEKALQTLITRQDDEALCSLFSTLSLQTLETQRRVRLLAESVATLFMDYGRYGADLFEGWEKSPHPHAKWQKELWDTLFGPFGTWHVPYQILQLLDLSKCTAPKQLQLHLFCHTDLSLLEQTLLQAFSLHRPVYIYQLSPTRMYWEDLLSPRAQLRLREQWEKRGVAVEELKQATQLLQEPSPLLSRLGQALHLRDHQLSGRILDRHENYAIPECLLALPTYEEWCDDSIEGEPSQEGLSDTPSLLQALQGDLLLLRRPNAEDSLTFSPEDRSIQLHAAPTPMREVEVIYNALLELMHDRPALKSRDIALYVVDLPRYLPFLRACFERKECRLKVEYLQLPLSVQSPYVQTFLTLIRLAKGRFSARELFNLLESPYIHTTAQITPQELQLLRRYMQRAPIYWGESTLAREAFLKKEACHTPLVEQSGVGTWQQGLTQLFVDLILGTKLHEPSSMTFSEAPLMEKWLNWFHPLQKDIEQLKSTEEHSLAEWTNLLCQLANRYMTPLNHDEENTLIERLKAFESISDNIQGTFPFSSILSRLELLLQQASQTHHEIEESIASIAPLGVNQIVPARIIGLLGLEEGAFPRKRRESPLDLLRGNMESERRPKQSDQERGLLLQALLSAKEALLMSYCSTSPHDGKIQGAAGPINELLDELNKGYIIDEIPAGTFITHHHPMQSYDPRYFYGKTTLSNSNKRDYQLACLYSGQDTHQIKAPEASSQSVAHPMTHADQAIATTNWSLRQLQLAAQDPCSLYLKEQLGITLLNPDRHILEEEEPFNSSSNTRYRLQDRALKGCVDSVLERAKTRGELPYGLFGLLSSKQVRSDIRQREQRLKQYQVEKSPSRLLLHPGCITPTYDEALGWQLPAHRLSSLEQGTLLFTGSLESFSPQGFLTHGTGTLEERATSWPLYLMFLLLRPQLEELLKCKLDPTCLFLGKEQRFTASLSSEASIEAALFNFIQYAEKAKKQCAPLHKDWLAPILQGDLTRAAQIMQTALEETDAWRYRHILWAYKQREDKNLHSWLQEWVDPLQQAYAPLL